MNATFYIRNEDILARYFTDLNYYHALIRGGHFKKMNEIVKSQSKFNMKAFEEWVNNLGGSE